MSAVTDLLRERITRLLMCRVEGIHEPDDDLTCQDCGTQVDPDSFGYGIDKEREIQRRADPLQRHLLCSATGLHDPNREGVCRDCELVVTDEPICRSEL